jgi:hypothetical protein
MRGSRRLGVLALAAALFAVLLIAASAFASKEAVSYIGGSGSGNKGGEFFNPGDVAVNSTGAGPAAAGDIYVADEFNNRVQRFDADGNFISAWGADVIEAGKPGDVAGTNPYEVCAVAADCQRGAESAGNGAASGNGSLNRPQSLAVDGDTGNVYVSDRLNNRVNEYAGDGTFIRSFGFGVDETTAGESYEVCPAADVCKAGVAGPATGQIGETASFGSGLGIAVSAADGNAATATVFLADTANRRVNTYDLDGTGPSSFGSSTQFGESQPRKVAVDSRGIVYASNSNGEGEIERYDSEDANGGGVGFLAPIASPPLLEGFAESATIGLAVDPDSDGAGPDQDVLYVLRGSSSTFKAVVQQFGPLNDPGLTAPPTAVDDTHGAGAEFAYFSAMGLGVDDASGRLFVSSSVAGEDFANRVYVLAEKPAPAASIDLVTSFDAHSATFSGEVNPNGALTGYHFEYVDDAEFQANGFANAQRYPLTDVRVGHGETPVSVENEIPHHLVPGTTYHVRLVAKRTFASAEAVSPAVTFTTPGASPSFDSDATDVGVDAATLRGAIDPEGQAVTNYHFEWGTTNAYGNSTPAGNLPSGSAPVAVEAELEGLTPGQTYHYRLVATNASGTTPGPDQTFTTMAAATQLPHRGYEIASQYPTGGVPIVQVTGRVVPSEDGNALAVGNSEPMANSTLSPLPDDPRDDTAGGPLQYVFLRGADSWQHRTELGIGGAGFSANLERFLTTTSTDGLGSGFKFEDGRIDPDDHNHSLDLYQRLPDGRLAWISRDPRIPLGTPQTAPGEAGLASTFNGSFTMSADGHTVVLKSQRQLLDVDTTSESGESAPFRLYKWEDGQLSFIGVRPDGSVPSGGSSLGDSFRYARYAVSRDGSRVIFSAGRLDGCCTPQALYVQTDGQPTVEATKEEGVPALPADQPYDVTYRGAAADGSRVFFTSASRMTPDSGAGASAGASNGGASDLYVYDVEADKLRDLTPRLDGIEDPSVDPPPTDRADVLGVAANSEDGKRVYFVANAQYPTAPNPKGDLPSATGPNFYVAELNSIDEAVKLRFIATLASPDFGDWQQSWIEESGVNRGKTALASDGGSVLGFGSTESLTGQPLGGTEQLFVYNADRGSLDCASCPTDGSSPDANVNEYFRGGSESVADWQGREGGVRRWVSSDGTVFFTTATALLPADQNLVPDVYEFRDGALGLISTGTATTASLFSAASRDGSTAFFNTQQAIAPQDKEPGIQKIYAARVGGGFSYVPPPPPCDFNAGACEGAPSTAPETPGSGTAAFEGPGDSKPGSKRSCPKGKRKVRTKDKARCVNKRHHKRNAKHNRGGTR